MLIQPQEMSWKFCSYEKTDSNLITSDWQILHKKENEDTSNETQAQYRALILDFCLPPAVYATMLIRELLKNDTSVANQIQMEKNATDIQNNSEAMDTVTKFEQNSDNIDQDNNISEEKSNQAAME